MPQIRNLSKSLAYRKRRFEDISVENGDSTISNGPQENEEDQPAISPATTPSKRKENKPKPTFLLGIDYGTTMTSVSYYKFKLGRRPVTKVSKEAIKSIISWPGAASSQNRGEVPSQSLYADGKYYWGYEAQQKAQEVLSNEEVDAAKRPIRFAKIFLEDSLKKEIDSPTSSSNATPLDSPARAAPYEGLKETLEALDKDIREVIRDYFVEILRHTMAQLMKYESFKSTSEVELALSVPAGWPLKASWALQDVLKQAVETVGFGQGFDLFLVNEPEAASAFVLDVLISQKMLATHETFVVCDAGGGTVDVTTYTIDSKSPFRFSESVAPDGGNYGSIYVNQAMERYFKKILSDNEALERKGISAEEQIQHQVLPRFESNLKRIFDSSKSSSSDHESFIIHGIEPDISKGFEKNRIKISCFDIQGWFQQSLDGTLKLVKQQLDSSSEGNKPVQKVLLVGGFSQSPTLRNALKEFLDPKIALLYQPDGEAETLVSRGAVYRALDKMNGPSRKIMANIGILQHEHLNTRFAGHRDTGNTTTRSPVDKKIYIYDCVNWIIKKGRVVASGDSFIEKHYQIFKEDENWEFSQRLYYSVNDEVEDHYRLDHEKNAGYEEAGMISVNLDRWREECSIPLKGSTGNRYYEVFYDFRMELHGRNLRVSVVYPPGQQEQSSLEICIAASFEPGTE